ncbi:YciI family protein [Nocardia sp. CA-084685]|uniref:YciI family protein n=1 Tax=Nocardia sp. CA-084685 TaxID=3239970 RepID=UPI003D96B8E2
MPRYLVLLYSPEGDEATQRQRWAQLPLWQELTDGLRAVGLLDANGALHGTDTATTVRVRDDEIEMTDGPFAITKEVLVGFYVLKCDDLDEVLRHAARFPTARYGSVEIRPIMEPTGDDPLG